MNSYISRDGKGGGSHSGSGGFGPGKCSNGELGGMLDAAALRAEAKYRGLRVPTPIPLENLGRGRDRFILPVLRAASLLPPPAAGPAAAPPLPVSELREIPGEWGTADPESAWLFQAYRLE